MEPRRLLSASAIAVPAAAGDATLTGNVTYGDFQILAANFGKSGGWDAGNFTYSSVVNFGANSSALTSGEVASLSSFAAEFGDTLVANPNGAGFDLVPADVSFTSLTSTTFTTGTASSFLVTTTGTPAATLTEHGALPTGVLFVAKKDGDAKLVGTPAPGTGGVYSIKFKANNGIALVAKQIFTLTVDQPPAFTSQTKADFTVGVTGSFKVKTTGFPIAALSISGNLDGLTFTDLNNGKATLSGDPIAGGKFDLILKAKNGVGEKVKETLKLVVTA